MSECKCTMSQRPAGDGCDACDPALALKYANEANETISDLRQELDEVLTAMRLAVELGFDEDAEAILAKHKGEKE